MGTTNSGGEDRENTIFSIFVVTLLSLRKKFTIL